MNGILIATRTGVTPASIPPAHRHIGARTVAAGGSAGNQAIRTLTALWRRAFGPASTDRQVAAHIDTGTHWADSARDLSAVPHRAGHGEAMQDRAIAKQDPDIAPIRRAGRLSPIVGMPSGGATEGAAMPTIALPPRASTLQNPTTADRVAGWRWVRALLRLSRGTAVTEASEVRFALPARPLSPLGFREFTAPRRLQGGGVLRLRAKAAGRIAAFDGLQSRRGRQR